MLTNILEYSLHSVHHSIWLQLVQGVISQIENPKVDKRPAIFIDGEKSPTGNNLQDWRKTMFDIWLCDFSSSIF